MANSLRSLWLAKQAKWLVQEEQSFSSKAAADSFAFMMRETNPGDRVRVTTFKLGPKRNPTTRYMVRRYAHRSGE